MRILHVWDNAGVAALLARYQCELGHEASVVKRDGFDGYGIDSFYHTQKLVRLPTEQSETYSFYLKLPKIIRKTLRAPVNFFRSLKFYLKVKKLSKNFDILHVHSLYWMFFVCPFKPKIFEFHGDDIRSCPTKKGWLKRKVSKLIQHFIVCSQTIYVSTPDLLEEVEGSIWLPNPVDVDHFKRFNLPMKNTALYFQNWFESPIPAQQLAKRKGWNLWVVNRKEDNILYSVLPLFMEKYEYFIDRRNIHSLSKTALEFLSLGGKVVRFDGEIVEHLDSCHNPVVAAEKTIRIYSECLENKK